MLHDVPPSRGLEGNPGMGLGGRTLVMDGKPHTAASNEAYLQRSQWVGPLEDDSAAIAKSAIPVTMMVLHGTVQDSGDFPVLPPGAKADDATLCSDAFYEDAYRRSFMAKNTRTDRRRGAGADSGPAPEARLVIFGVDATGRRITLHMPFRPYIYMLAGEWKMDVNQVKTLWKKKVPDRHQSICRFLHSLYTHRTPWRPWSPSRGTWPLPGTVTWTRSRSTSSASRVYLFICRRPYVCRGLTLPCTGTAATAWCMRTTQTHAAGAPASFPTTRLSSPRRRHASQRGVTSSTP